MAAKNEQRLGTLELEVLKIIWECPGSTVAEVAERLSLTVNATGCRTGLMKKDDMLKPV